MQQADVESVVLTVVERGGLTESWHRGRVAIWGPTGLVLGLGDVSAPVFCRSSLKPLQALPALEIGLDEKPYVLPEHRNDYSGILISLAKQEHPDTSAYDDPEIVWRMKKKHHAGLIVASPEPQRAEDLLKAYAERFVNDFLAVAPLPDKPWT